VRKRDLKVNMCCQVILYLEIGYMVMDSEESGCVYIVRSLVAFAIGLTEIERSEKQ
jgi:hypothetical protein